MGIPLRTVWPAVPLFCLALGPSALWGAEAETAEDEQVLKKARVGTDGPALLDFFRKRTVTRAGAERITGLVGKLGDKSFKVRTRASKELVRTGVPALP